MKELELKTLHLEMQKNIAVLCIDNPPVNSLNAQVMNELEQAVDYLADCPVRALVIASKSPKAFVAGADITQFSAWGIKEGEAASINGNAVFQALQQLPFPVICAIDGYAFGGGLELALACDLRVMAATVQVGLPEVTLGIYPGYGGTQRLQRLVGAGHARRLIFTGSPISAQEAYRIGLCEVLAEKGTALEEALLIAKKIAKAAPLAVRNAKAVMCEGAELPLNEALALEAKQFGVLCDTEDKIEGVNAFLEKRVPHFIGK